MIQKLLLIIRLLFLKFSDLFSEKSFTPSVKLFCFGMLFVCSFNYGQCVAYPTAFTTTQIGAEQFFCIDGTNPSVSGVAAENYIVVNVIKGFTYTFSVPNIWNNEEYLGLFNDAAGNAFLAQNNGASGTSITWTAGFSGKIRVLLLRGNSCAFTNNNNTTTISMSLNISTLGNTSTIDSQTAYGNGVWKGYIYNWTGSAPPGGSASPAILSETTYPFITGSATNYAGYYDVGSEAFPPNFNFGGDDDVTCFDVYSEGNVRGSILTQNFAVRYRMKSIRPAGCYFVKVTGDDGVRLYIDNKIVFDKWIQQTPTNYDYILVKLAANSNLVFDYYENTGNNQANFQIQPFDPNANTIVAPAIVNFCSGGDPSLIDGSFKYNNQGAEDPNPYINYQWKVSTNGAPYINVTPNGNSRTYDPPAIANATGTNIVTKYKRIATVNTVNAVGVDCTFNESNEVTFITSTNAPATPAVISGTTTQCPSVTGQIYSITAVTNAISYNWIVPTGWSITSGAGSTSITVSTGTSGQNGNITVQAINGCTPSNAARSLPVTVGPVSVGGTISGSSVVCAGVNSTVFSLGGNAGNILRWESSTDNFASVVTPIVNTTTTYTANNITITTYYRAVVQNGNCSIVTSSVGSVVTKNPVATGVTICKGGSGSLTSSSNCGVIVQTPVTAAGAGGTSNTTNYGGSGNTNITVTVPVLPPGAVITATDVVISYNAINPSYRSELLVRVTPPTAVGSIQSDIKPSNLASWGVITNAPLGAWSTGNPAGNWLFEFRESLDDASVNPDATISNITVTVNYTLPATLDWFTASSGGTKIGSGASFNPVGVAGSGLTNTNTPGTTPYYVACSSDATCRTLANFVINDTPTISGTLNACEGSTTSLTGSGTPNAINPWVSASTAVATVNNAGIVTGVAAGTSVITYTNNNGCTVNATVTINPSVPSPTIGTIKHIVCGVPTGSMVLSGLPSGNWIINQTGFVANIISNTTAGTTSYTVTGLAAGTYQFSVSNGTCTSAQTAGTTINDQPSTTWDGNQWSNGDPDATKKVIVTSVTPKQPFTASISSCSLIIAITGAGQVIIPADVTLTVTNAVTSDGKLNFKNNSSLIQVNTDPSINTGSINYERISPPIFQKDYLYWSTPVNPQKLVDVSPQTTSTKYFGNDGTKWVVTDRQSNMVIGKGYIIRGPANYDNTTKQTFTTNFIGVPNNGDLEGELLEGNKYYVIGNPYPSALSADELVNGNKLLLNGTMYFWTHNTAAKPIATNQYTNDDYASYNLSGGVSAKSDIKHNDDPAQDKGTKPTGKIAAGQAFYISTKAVGGKVQFRNTMRLGAADNTQFFKLGESSKEASVEKNRIWINMTSATGAFKQILVGYIDGATNDFESAYDGLTLDGNTYIDFYSVNNTAKYVIQGRALPFTDTDIVPLGYRTSIEGDFTIAIDEADGNMKDQAIYVEDKATGVVHDLRTSNYTFKTTIGTFTDRLVLRYTNKTLGTGDFDKLENGISVSIKNKEINVLSSQENIKEVSVFDISGRQLYNKKKVGVTELQIKNLQSSNQVLLVKVTLENNFTSTKKVIFQ